LLDPQPVDPSTSAETQPTQTSTVDFAIVSLLEI
jgi:hypothetical protein